MKEPYLPGRHHRAQWMRLDTAEILKRFFFCERSLIVSQAGWLAGIASFEVKTTLSRFLWQDAMTANALRDRVLELRYPSRLIEVGEDVPLIAIFDEAIHAPGPEAFILGIARVLKPALLAAYREYVNKADELADGPSLRFMRLAVEEKAEQVAVLIRFAQEMLRGAPERSKEAEAWASALSQRLLEVGGVSFEEGLTLEMPVHLPGRRSFELAQIAARDERFHLCRYYWPDVIDASFPYGEGVRLQLRSAISHFNEIWAVETGGAILHAFANDLPWEFMYDAARWTYDEARHACMGYSRLRAWGFEPHEIPLGSYIYDSARDQDAFVRLGMLHYFETKNIGKKTKRTATFASYQDNMSQHDMDFDWADETIHAYYGRHWYEALQRKYPDRVPDVDVMLDHCDLLVAAQIARATDGDREDIRQVAEAMIRKAERVSLIVG